MINDVAAKGLADTSSVVAVGVSRGAYAVLRLASRDSRVSRLILMAPVTDLQKLEEFSHVPVNEDIYGFRAAYRSLSKDHIFLMIGNSDSRVGTADSLKFGLNVVAAADENNLADITTVVLPLQGHRSAFHEMAAKWAIKGLDVIPYTPPQAQQ